MADNKLRTLVVGTGISGVAAASLLIRNGADVVMFDSNEALDIEALRQKDAYLKEVEVITGSLSKEQAAQFGRVVLSPGVPTDLPMVQYFYENEIPVIGEIELAYSYAKGKMAAITGTNGKTTTTTLVGEILKKAYKDVFVVGNIGIPYTQMAMQTTDDSATVAEISSFQLETVTTFHPAVSAILNVTPDHLNRHHTMENYMEAKGKIALHQTKDEVCVLNYDNSYTRAFGAKCRAKVVWFSSKEILDDGYYLKDGFIYQANGGESSRLLAVSEMHLVGTCNYENVMAAIAIGTAMGVSMESILDTVRNFHAVEHRIEYVTTKRGVRFYNDSKGTNPDAAIQGIRAMDAPTCLIGGGYDKESEYDEWIKAFDGKVKKLVLIGQTAQKIAQTAKRLGFTDYIFADSLNEAIDLCYENAKEGECVLLSPACASWGMFTNYEERGNQFKEYVRALKE